MQISDLLQQFDWKTALNYSLTAIMMRYVLPWLKQHRMAAEAIMGKANIDTTTAISAHLEDFLCTVAGNTAEEKFPELARQIQSGSVTSKEQIKQILASWGADLKKEAIGYFQNQNVDLLDQLGEKAIDRLIEQAANKVSPFPGMETSDALLRHGVADVLIQKGVNYVKEKAAELDCKACIPPCGECPIKTLVPEKEQNVQANRDNHSVQAKLANQQSAQ